MIKQLKALKKSIFRLFYSRSAKRHELVGPPKLWKMKQDFQINFLKNQGLKTTDKVLDIGCGTLRGGVPIIDFLEEGNYTGIEVREHVLNEGKKELKEHKLEHKKPNLICFDEFGKLSIDTKFDIIFSYSVLIHLEDSIAKACFEFVGRHLAEDGVYYANVNIGERADAATKWQGFPITWRSLDFYKGLAEENGLKVSILGTVGELGHNSGVEQQDKQPMLEIRRA